MISLSKTSRKYLNRTQALAFLILSAKFLDVKIQGLLLQGSENVPASMLIFILQIALLANGFMSVLNIIRDTCQQKNRETLKNKKAPPPPPPTGSTPNDSVIKRNNLILIINKTTFILEMIFVLFIMIMALIQYPLSIFILVYIILALLILVPYFLNTT